MAVYKDDSGKGSVSDKSPDELIKELTLLLEERTRRRKYAREYMKKYRDRNPEYRKKCIEYSTAQFLRRKKEKEIRNEKERKEEELKNISPTL